MHALISVAPTHAGTLIGVTELDEEALVARVQFVRAVVMTQQRDVSEEAAADIAHPTPNATAAPAILPGWRRSASHRQ